MSVISGRGIEAVTEPSQSSSLIKGCGSARRSTSSSTNLTCELTFMLFIWSGWGILVVPIVVGTSIIIGALAQLSLQALGHPELAFLAFSLGLFAAAALNWVVGRRLNSTPPRELIDPATNARVLLTRRHALFWIRMEYWSAPVVLAAFVPLLALRNL